MNERLTCAACGHVGYDVSTRIVRIDDPEATTRIASVTGEYRVPAKYTAELRCADSFACRDRQDQPTSGEPS